MNCQLFYLLITFSSNFIIIFCSNRNAVDVDKRNTDERFLKKQNLIELITDDLSATSNRFNANNNKFSTNENSKIPNNHNSNVNYENIAKEEYLDIMDEDLLISFERMKKSTLHVNNYEDINQHFDDVEGSGDQENYFLVNHLHYKVTDLKVLLSQEYSSTLPKPGQRSLVIVFDGTASMTDDLDQLRSGAEYIIEKLKSRSDNPIYNYIFVPFRDPDVGPKLVTTNHEKLLQELKSLKLRGGGDCPEHALGGIISALESALPQSFIYVFTDAVASDYYLQDKVLQLVQKKQTPITFFITGYCKLENSSEHLVYQKIASASNGQIFDLKKNDIKQVIESMELLLNVNRIPVKYIDSSTNDSHSIDLNVDKTLKEFTVSVAGSEPNITVKNPKNETINSSADILNLENLKIVKIRDPEVGTWNIQAGSVSPHSVHLSGIAEVTFDYGFTTKGEPETIDVISHKPKANLENVLSIIPSDPSLIDKLTSITLKLFDGDNDRERFTFDLPLKKIKVDDKEVYVTIPIPLPRQLFKISITGRDRNGNPFERLLSTAITTVVITEAPDMFMEVDTYEAKENELIILKCKIDSLLPVTARWMRASRVLKQNETLQEQYEFNYQIDKADLSDSGLYTCVAENEYGIISKTATVKVSEKVLIVFTPNKNILTTEGDTNIEIECNINVIDGVDVSWSLNDTDILSNTNYELLDNSNLLIKLVARNISGNFKCCGIYGGQTKCDFMEIDVKYPAETDELLNENITIPYGESINITCNSIGNPTPNVTWIITSFDHVKYAMNEKSIYIEKMTVNDEGIYMCKLYNGIGDSILRVVNLDGGPDKHPLNIIKSSGQPLTIVVNENDNVNISCQCNNCLPLLSDKWVGPHNSSIIDNNVQIKTNTYFETTQNGLVKRYNNNLFIDNIKINQAGNYRCELKNSYGSAEMTYRIKVLSVNPVTKLNAGNMFSIKCALNNDEIVANLIEWRKDGEVILNDVSNKNLILDNDNRSLVVNEVHQSDAGVYSCQSVGPNGNVMKNFTLLVVVHKTQSIQTAVLGDRVILPCKLRQLNSPEVTWRLNGRDINMESNNQDTGKYKQVNNSLLFNAGSTDTGIYQCEIVDKTNHTVVEEELVLVIYSSPYIYPAHDEIVEVTSNSDILLQCESKGVPVPTVTWYFDNHILQNSSLLIKNISKTNEGPYVCNAFNGIGTQQKVFHIVVYDKPKIISNVPELLKIKSDDSLNITCDAIGNPEPFVYWTKIEINNLVDPHLDALNRNIDNILLVDSSSISGLYKCVAENRFGVDTKDMLIEVIKHPRIKRNDTNHPYFNTMQILIKEPAEIICPIENYEKVSWYKNGKPLNLRSSSLQLQNNNLSVTIPSVSSHNDGNYTCVSESSSGIINYTIAFHVLEPPNKLYTKLLNNESPENIMLPSDFTTIPEIKIKAGDQFIINCSSKGKPEPQYFWKKNENIIVNSSLLKIYDLTLNDSGIYTCIADNMFGDNYLHYQLIVISEPKLQNDNDDDEYIMVGAAKKIKLNCNMIGYPYPEIIWYKDNVLMDGAYQEIIEIWHADVDDGGEYKCVATNEHGSSEKTFFINIFDSPSVTFITSSVSPIKPNGFNFTCIASGVPMPILTWTYNGRSLTTTSKMHNSNLTEKLLHGDLENPNPIYVDQHGNSFSVNNNIIPFEIHSGNKIKNKKLEALRYYGVARVIDKNKISLDLIFPKSRTEFSGKYDCVAINSNGRDNKSVIAEVIVPPHNPYNKVINQNVETMKPEFSEIETLMGLPILLNCPFIGKPTPEYHWYKEDQKLNVHSENFKLENAAQMLTITESTEEHNGNYKCLAHNDGGTSEHKFNVTILVPPTFLNTIQSINDNNLDEYDFSGNVVREIEVNLCLGDTLSLECPVYAIPKPEIYWFKLIDIPGPRDPTITSKPIKILQTTNSNLVIPAVKESAIYVCSANNSIGTVDKLYRVFVESAPVVNGTDSKEEEIVKIFEVAAQIYHGFTLECNLVGTPEPNIRWMKNKIEIKKNYITDYNYDDVTYKDLDQFDEGTDFEYDLEYNDVVVEVLNNKRKRKTVNERGIFISSDRRVLRIISSSKEDGGLYSCFGSNKHGTAEQIFNVKIDVPVEYSPWGPWTVCSATCGKGLRKRYRTCLLPNGNKATELDKQCDGIDNQTQNCEDSPCPVNGGWNVWSPWSSCTSSCINEADGIDSVRRRHRKCDAPVPKRGGRPCLGASTQIESCVVQRCSIHGGWTAWTEWSFCSVTCGTGVMKRRRFCSNPEPKYEGLQCTGLAYEVKSCFETKCPIDGGWSHWSTWSYCSKSCGQGGFKQRKRTCNHPEPAFGGKTCFGGNIEISLCQLKDCPVQLTHLKSLVRSKPNQKIFTPLLSFDTLPLSIKSTYTEPRIKSKKYSESRIPNTEYVSLRFKDPQIAVKVESSIPIRNNLQEMNMNIPTNIGTNAVIDPEQLRKTEKIRTENCDKGYTQDFYDPEICIDINECLEFYQPCHQTEVCINKIGSFICECPPGYISMHFGSPCLDINECSQQIHNCSHNCQNTDGSYKCSCPDNFILSENGQTCILRRTPREKQNQNFTLKHTFPLNLCEVGFHLKNETCDDIDECVTMKNNCNINETCLNTRGSHFCLQTGCPESYLRDQTSGQCIQMCVDFPNHKCSDGAVIAQSISYTVIATQLIYENVPFLKLMSYDVFNNPLKNTKFTFIDGSHYNHLFGLEKFESDADAPSGYIYILVKRIEHLRKEKLYKVKISAKSYDFESPTLLYVTQFVIFVYIN